MSISAQQWNDAPIILMTVVDPVDDHDVITAYMQSIDLANSMSDCAYRVVDLRQAADCYQQVINTIRDTVKSLAGAVVYPQMNIAFVGISDMQKTVDASEVLFFTQMDDALIQAGALAADLLTA
jgi:hypothetical protein